ncbi:MAG: HEAT repeat domain-containing protein [Bdellovibrionales bacterium]|nr:HEAT repeat domain-containing protein [Bdellovibrionales bacterium]
MKKILLPILIIGIIGVGYLTLSKKPEDVGQTESQATQNLSSNTLSSTAPSSTSSSQQSGDSVQEAFQKALSQTSADSSVYEDISASEKYTSSDEAIAALKAGAKDYDDLTLQHFVELGDCAWCNDLYNSLQTLVKETTDEDEMGYYAEALAVSGKPENIAFLVQGIQSETNEDRKDILAEALELTVGGEDVVNYLIGFTSDNDELLRESAVAAISNQGSLLAAQHLYELAVKNNDPDGYYSLGIGLGEMIPDEEAFGFLQESLMKRDAYAHLAAKALINAGLPGLAITIDVLSNVQNEKLEQDILDGAFDHVAYDEETEAYLTKLQEQSKIPYIKDWASKVLKDFSLDEDDEDFDDDEDEDDTQ